MEIKIRNYNDLIENKIEIEQYSLWNDRITILEPSPASNITKDSAADENVARSMMAKAILSQVKKFYNYIKNNDWCNNIKKYIILRQGNNIIVGETYYDYHFLAFYTENDRDEFLKYNREEIEYYFMIK